MCKHRCLRDAYCILFDKRFFKLVWMQYSHLSSAIFCLTKNTITHFFSWAMCRNKLHIGTKEMLVRDWHHIVSDYVECLWLHLNLACWKTQLLTSQHAMMVERHLVSNTHHLSSIQSMLDSDRHKHLLNVMWAVKYGSQSKHSLCIAWYYMVKYTKFPMVLSQWHKLTYSW